MKNKLIFLFVIIIVFAMGITLVGCASTDGDTINKETSNEEASVVGLEYILNDEGTEYSVAGIGTETAENINIPNEYNGNPVTKIENSAFSNCTFITSVTIGENVTSIGDSAFRYCSSLTSIIIGKGIKEIGGDAFFCCYRLVEIYNLSSLIITAESISLGYVGFYALDVYTDSNIVSKLWEDSNGFVISTDGIDVKLISYMGESATIEIPGEVTEINRYSFYESFITSVTIGENVTSIGDSAFRYCSSLTSMTIGENVTSIGDSAFYGCQSLVSVTIPDGILSIENYLFSNCGKLVSVTIPDSVKSIGDYAFNNCFSLISIDLDNVVIIGKYSFSSSGLGAIAMDSVTAIGEGAFSYCNGFTSMNLGNNVEIIDELAFFGCENIIEFKVSSDNVNYSVIDGSLYNKDASTIIQYTVSKTATVFALPNSVTVIGSGAFAYCENLARINLSGITEICSKAFGYCTSLSTIDIPVSVVTMGEFAFHGCNITINCEVESVPSGWKSSWCISSYSAIIVNWGVATV